MEDLPGVNANGLGEQEATSSFTVPDSKSTEWTDEKHCLFLKHMESTFVNQLYKSIDLYGWHSQKNSQTRSKSSEPKPPNAHASPNQFKVLRDGRWSKIEFKRDKTEVNQGDESNNASKSPWIQHYRSPQKQQTASSLVKASFQTNEDRYQAIIDYRRWSQDSVGSNAEVTDQNFVEEARDEDR